MVLLSPALLQQSLLPPLPLPFDLLQPSSSSSSYWHLLPSPGVAPSFGTPQAHCQCLLHLLSISILCYTPLHCQLSPPWAKNKSRFPNIIATFLVSFCSPCPFSCPDPPSPVPHFPALCCLLPHAYFPISATASPPVLLFFAPIIPPQASCWLHDLTQLRAPGDEVARSQQLGGTGTHGVSGSPPWSCGLSEHLC